MCDKLNLIPHKFCHEGEKYESVDNKGIDFLMEGDNKTHLVNTEYGFVFPEPFEYCPFCGEVLKN